MGRRVQISVVGGSVCSHAVARMAEELGREIASHGAVLVCGGLAGVMAGAAAGAHRAGGLTIGFLPGYDRNAANPFIDVVVPTGMGHARNVLVVAAGDAVIALPGEHGTASEISLALALGKPVVGLGAWGQVDGVEVATTVPMAVELALAASRERTPSES